MIATNYLLFRGQDTSENFSLLRKFDQCIRSLHQQGFGIFAWRLRSCLRRFGRRIVPDKSFRNRRLADFAVNNRNLGPRKLRFHETEQLISLGISQRHLNGNLTSFKHGKNIQRHRSLCNAHGLKKISALRRDLSLRHRPRKTSSHSSVMGPAGPSSKLSKQ